MGADKIVINASVNPVTANNGRPIVVQEWDATYDGGVGQALLLSEFSVDDGITLADPCFPALVVVTGMDIASNGNLIFGLHAIDPCIPWAWDTGWGIAEYTGGGSLVNYFSMDPNACGPIAIGPGGDIWTSSAAGGTHVRKHDRNTGAELLKFYSYPVSQTDPNKINLRSVSALTFDNEGNLFIAESGRIVKISSFDSIAGSPPGITDACDVEQVGGIDLNSDSYPDATTDPNFWYGAGDGEFGSVSINGIDIDTQDFIYATDPNNEQRIQIFDPNGTFVKQLTDASFDNTGGSVNVLTGVAVDVLGNVYAADGGTFPDIHKYAAKPIIPPTDCFGAKVAGFSLPLDYNNNCYVDLPDLAEVILPWLECTQPQEAGCMQELVPRAHQIPRWAGAAINIDGDLTEDAWTVGGVIDPCWMDLDYVYFNGADPCTGYAHFVDPCDITSAKFAVYWDPDPCLIYLAVKVVDTDHVFKPATNWDDSDRIEIYMQGDPNGGSDWGTFSGSVYFDKAQQYATGRNGPPGFPWYNSVWGVFGNGATVPAIGNPDNAGFAYKVKVSGSEIRYEVAIKPWVWYGGRYSGVSEVRELDVGVQIGFDVIVGSRHGTVPRPADYDAVEGKVRPDYAKDCADPNWADWCLYDLDWANLSENYMTMKFEDAGQFRRYQLVDTHQTPPPCGTWGWFDRSDLNFDCDMNLGDFDVFKDSWGDCIDAANPNCSKPWLE